jgi:assimilatory nitrate reductase catalytic subunit
MFRWIADSAGDEDSELVVVDPVHSETVEVADDHVAPDPAGDLDFARAVLAHAVETDRIDEAFVAEATEGFNDLCAGLPGPREAAARAGVDFAAVEAMVDRLESDTLIYWGMGVNQSVQGTDTAGALIDLCLATGNMGPGSGPFSLTGQANSMGTRVCSSKGSWPGHRDFDDPDHRERVAEEWSVPVERLPEDTGPGPVGTFEAVLDGPIEAMYAVATNPVAGAPDAATVEEALEEAFLVVQDSFRTETVEYADVVLPAATWGESEGTAINMERTVSRVRAATDLPSGVRTDLDLITSVGNALFDDLFETSDPEAHFEEFVSLTEGAIADCSGLSYDRLDEEMAVRWPAPDPDTSVAYRYFEETDEEAAEDGDDGGGVGTTGGTWAFPTPSGRARFAGGTGRALPEETDDEYPLVLNTARAADGYNSGVRSRASPDDPGDLVARIHPDTVAAYVDPVVADGTGADESPASGGTADPTGAETVDAGAEAVAEGADGTESAEALIRIESPRGSATAVVDADDAIPEGMVWLPIHHPATNRLTVPATDPQSDEPNLKQCAVRLAAPDSRAAERAGTPARADD